MYYNIGIVLKVGFFLSEQSITNVFASVVVYDDQCKKWIPSGSSGTQGVSKVQIFHHLQMNTFRVVGRKTTQDHEVIVFFLFFFCILVCFGTDFMSRGLDPGPLEALVWSLRTPNHGPLVREPLAPVLWNLWSGNLWPGPLESVVREPLALVPWNLWPRSLGICGPGTAGFGPLERLAPVP